MRDGDASATMLAAKLSGLLSGKSAPEERDAAWQDSLDLLAVASGAKPVALIGCGYAGGAWLDAVAELAQAFGLAVRRGGMPWLVAEEFVGLPGWYVGPLPDSWAAADMLTVTRTAAAAQFGAAPVMLSMEEEAALLGYPACCLADHHAGRRRFHALMVELIEAAYASEAERRRFAASELPPPVRDEADRRRLAETLQSAPLAFAGFEPCPVCAALGARGPAGRVAARMRDLAAATGFAPLAPAGEA